MKTFVATVVALSLSSSLFHLKGDEAKKADKKMDGRVFELRTYYAACGKMEALHARFRDHAFEVNILSRC